MHVVVVGSATLEVARGLALSKTMLKAASIEAETSTLLGQPDSTLGKLFEEAPFCPSSEHLALMAA